jgi:hypothetical protein
MNKEDIRKELIKLCKNVCDNVYDKFIHPEDFTALQVDFPYITITYGNTTYEGGSNRGIQTAYIIGYVKKDNDSLADAIDELEIKLWAELKNSNNPKPFQIVVEEVDNSNIFKPFGLDAGVFPPYAAFRMTVKIPQVKMI